MAFCPGLSTWAGTKRNIHQLTPILTIKRPLSTSSTTTYSILLIQFTRLTVLFHHFSPGPFWSSSNRHLFFATHAHTTPACFAVVLMLCRVMLCYVIYS